MKSSSISAVVIVGVVFVAIGVIVGLSVKLMPVEGSVESVSVDTLFSVMLSIAVVVFLIVEGGIIWSIIRYRNKRGDMSDGPASHGNTALEITWTAIPAVIVFVLTIYSYNVFSNIQAPHDGELVIGVTGQQFQWSFTYPYTPDPKLTDEQNKSAAGNMIAKELHLPVGRPVRVDIQSLDVMHGFYIPEFRIKQDAIPGRLTSTRFTPSQPGEYWVLCSELCGQGHAGMSQVNKVFVETPADYDKFLEGLRADAIKAVTDPTTAANGKRLITSGKYPCGACHTITDAATAGTVGPKLDGVATRATNDQDGRLEGENVKSAADYIRVAIQRPSAYLVPGFSDLMPKDWIDPLKMPDTDLQAIVNYLLSPAVSPQDNQAK